MIDAVMNFVYALLGHEIVDGHEIPGAMHGHLSYVRCACGGASNVLSSRDHGMARVIASTCPAGRRLMGRWRAGRVLPYMRAVTR